MSMNRLFAAEQQPARRVLHKELELAKSGKSFEGETRKVLETAAFSIWLWAKEGGMWLIAKSKVQ
ncbi:MAG: hypothetical protein IPP88_06755 [Betaproteobacteria bacterium]|nr:hypothetical protein [Betaproteobacteria bacterium]